MIKIFFTVLSLIVAENATFAQLVMTSSFNPIIGDVQNNVNADTSINPIPTGINFTWDFSALSIKSNVDVTNYVAPSSTPNGSAFPSSNIATSIPNSNYSYLSLTSSKYEIVGYFAQGVQIVYSDPNTLFTYPFTYNSIVNDSLSATFTSGVLFYRSGVSTTQGDGYGTLILPAGTHTNVLRVKVIQDYTDSSSFGKFFYHIEVYYWYSSISKFPLLMVSTASSTGMQNTYTKTVYVNDLVTGNQELNINKTNVKLFPNPSHYGSVITYYMTEPSIVKISLLNLTGQTVREFVNQKERFGEHHAHVNFEGITSGIYIMNINTGSNTSQVKVTIN